MTLPEFRYHPDPDTVEESDNLCLCCEQHRGFIYTGPVFAVEDLDDALCPWCIASGEAAKKFEACFSDAHALCAEGIDNAIVAEVTQRTPGYLSWQQDHWMSHCGDACVYEGDATEDDVRQAGEATIEHWLAHKNVDRTLWQHMSYNYVTGGDVAFYRFRCRHCNLVLLGSDLS